MPIRTGLVAAAIATCLIVAGCATNPINGRSYLGKSFFGGGFAPTTSEGAEPELRAWLEGIHMNPNDVDCFVTEAMDDKELRGESEQRGWTEPELLSYVETCDVDIGDLWIQGNGFP